jgi:hypothetical protein
MDYGQIFDANGLVCSMLLTSSKAVKNIINADFLLKRHCSKLSIVATLIYNLIYLCSLVVESFLHMLFVFSALMSRNHG